MDKYYFDGWTLLYEGKGYPSNCPNDVLTDLYKAGVIPDPYFGKNAEKAREYLKKPAVYQASFSLGELPKSLRFHFEGIDTFASIYCNGKLLGSTDNMFLAYDFEASSSLKVGENVLQVALSPVYDHLDGQDHGTALFNTERLQVRKVQCHFGWDWAPDLPGYGIYLPAYYFIDDDERLDDLYLDPHNDGSVEAQAQVRGGSGRLSLKIEGRAYGPFAVKEGLNKFSFQIASPKLWFPNGYGEQPLYHYLADLTFDDGSRDSNSGHFAFREIKTIEAPLKDGRTSFALSVNGQTIFAKGSNWVPISNQTGSIPDSSYAFLLRKAQEAHYNLLRVWGGGLYEKELFYDLCDSLGLLVYQDFMYSCQGVPSYPGFIKQAEEEALYQCLRLRKHPCLAFLSGGNELYKHREEEDNPLNHLLGRIAKETMPNLPYVSSSPFGHNEDLWSSESGDVHKSVFELALINDDVAGFEKYLDANRSCFFSECTCLGSCSYKSLKRFIPEADLWPLNGSYDYHFTRNPYALDPSETFALKELKLAEGFYGKVTGAADFAKKSMLAQARILEKEITHARADIDGHGHLNWMYNDNWGNGTWSLIDAYLNPKAAYYAQKRSFAPILLCFVLRRGQVTLHLINEGRLTLQGQLRLDYGQVDGKILANSVQDVVLLSGERREWSFRSDLPAEYCYAEFISEGKAVAADVHFYKPLANLAFMSDVKVVKIWQTAEGCHLELQAHSFAHAVHFEFERALEYSDDYFDVGAGRRKEVIIRGLKSDEVPKLKILTFADRWDD